MGQLEEAFKPGVQAPIAVDLVGLKVVAERLQFPDPTDPALAGRGGGREKRERSRTSITFRVAINAAIVSRKTVTIEVPSFRAEGACIELDQVLYEGVIQSREALTVEVVAGEAGEGPVDGERVRFTDTMEGNPSSWVGMHTPRRGRRGACGIGWRAPRRSNITEIQARAGEDAAILAARKLSQLEAGSSDHPY